MRNFKIITAVLMMLTLLLGSAACDKKEGNKDQKTPEVSFTPAASPTTHTTTHPTDAPTPEATSTPVPTIEPGTGKYAEGIADEEKGILAQFYKSDSAQTASYCSSSMAVQFFATTLFNAVDVICPTWTKTAGHSIHFTLYRWAGTYFDTIAGEPVADKVFTDYSDGAFNTLAFEEQTDGEYLLYITNDEGWQNCGVWYKNEEHESQISYINDEIWEEAAIRLQVHYTKTPNKRFGPLSDPGQAFR